jgi:demethylmenaquinone methyltransferase/2-methoxy-6-polyprenyl-1,4-benzoquinol methylase
MATILRDWSYRYQWLYDSIARISALSVGGEARFRQLALTGLPVIPGMQVLDLCCGSGQATQYLVEKFGHHRGDLPHVTGLDASPFSIQRARRNVPEATFVEGWAEAMPFSDAQFDLVHTSVALHEMTPTQLQKILQEVYRVLKPGGIFTCIDVHSPTNPIMVPGLYLFLWLFETETAWQLIRTDLVDRLEGVGFQKCDRTLHAGGSLQVIQAYKGNA